MVEQIAFALVYHDPGPSKRVKIEFNPPIEASAVHLFLNPEPGRNPKEIEWLYPEVLDAFTIVCYPPMVLRGLMVVVNPQGVTSTTPREAIVTQELIRNSPNEPPSTYTEVRRLQVGWGVAESASSLASSRESSPQR